MNPQSEHALRTVSILGTPIARVDLNQAIQLCLKRVESKSGGYVCFVNVHTLVEGVEKPQLGSALKEAFLALPDGMPLVWTSHIKNQPVGSRVCGPDFMTVFLSKAPHLSHGLIGGMALVPQALAKKFGIHATCFSPPVRPFLPDRALEDWNAFLKLCPNQRAPSIVWVGLGAPKQELWIQTISKVAPETLFFGVGAAFDFLAGTKNRAPRLLQKLGLEWAFRFGQEPKRLGNRYFHTGFSFIWHLAYDLMADFKRR